MRAALLLLVMPACLALVWCADDCLVEKDIYICQQLPPSFPAGLTSIVVLVNNLGEINSTVFSSPNLASVTSLTMSRTGITDISPGAFDLFQQLAILRLHGNYLSKISSTWFSHLGVLESLILSSNHIEALDEEAFDGLSTLKSLNLSGNQIRTITPGSFCTLGKLKHLDLSGNNLTHVSPETLLPLNSTRIRLDGNPWDCSCAAQDFVTFLKGVQNASLLENEMEVLCESPAPLRGQPVWNVSECLNPSTDSHTETVVLSIRLPALVGVVVVLCALVCVVCALSVLYHRKREKKQIQPCPEDLEKSGTVESKETGELESGKTTPAFQVHDADVLQRRLGKERAQSAGPVLSRARCSGPSLDLNQTSGIIEDLQGHGREQDEDTEEKWDEADEKKTKDKGTPFQREEKKTIDEGTPIQREERDLPAHDVPQAENGEDGAAGSVGNQTPLQGDKSNIQTSEDTENLPYLTIGTDLAKQSQSPGQGQGAGSRGQLPQRSIRRVSTWPPAMVPWKRWLARDGEALINIFPKPIVRSEIRRDNELLPADISSERCGSPSDLSPESPPSVSPADLSPESPPSVSPADLSPESPPSVSLVSATESLLMDVPLREDNRVTTAEETCRPDFETSTQSGLVSISQSLSDAGKNQSYLDGGEQGKPRGDTERGDGGKRQKKAKTTPKTSTESKTALNESRRAQRESKRRLKEGDRDQAHTGSCSLAPSAGSSPGDENLLLDNEYAFIDLLHEVVQNQGRWTRDHWKQTHMNKQRSKHQGQAH